MSWKRALSRSLGGAIALSALLAPACGARSELPVRERDAGGPDAALEAPCGSFAVPTTPAALEVFVAMDTSGSMADLTSQGVKKLDAVRKALEQFLIDPDSAGIGVTFTFFPIVNEQVPDFCTSDVSCGMKGACKGFSLCVPSAAPCDVQADCPAGEPCAVMGVCPSLTNLCAPGILTCPTGDACAPGGWCQNHVSCDASAYAPSKPPALLPDGALPLVAQLPAETAEGGTPTLPALAGTIEAARARQAALPNVKAIVLLATDGFPTLCDPAIPSPFEQSSSGVPAVVSTASLGKHDGVQTFVIGVFAPEEAAEAQQNLDAIAQAGGSDAAYVITTNQSVTDELVVTLNEIRSSAAACDYVLPKPGGVPLDASNMKVRIESASGTKWLDPETALAGCDAIHGGYVLDKLPGGPEPPTRLQLCPASCALMEGDPTAVLDVVVECLDQGG